jgi:hypothetical protein
MVQSKKKGVILYKNFKTFLWLLPFVLLLGCTKPNYHNQKSALIVIKSDRLKYADMGFVYHANNQSKVQIYSSGQAILTLTIHPDSICMDSLKCLPNKSFNKEFLSANYPDGFLANIFNQKPIFANQNLIKTAKGFKQRIHNSKVDIEYSVENSRLLFRDRSNNVLIKIKEQ